MAHFYGTLQGSRGAVSRLGTKNSGIVAEINGWDIGCRVVIEYNAHTKTDFIEVYKTGGSNVRSSRRIARFSVPPQEERIPRHD